MSRFAEKFVDGLVQFLCREWLAQESLGAALEGFDSSASIGERGNDEDPCVSIDPEHFAEASQAIYLWHGDIHRNEIGILVAEDLNSLTPIRRGEYLRK